jgi:hypothetical protein
MGKCLEHPVPAGSKPDTSTKLIPLPADPKQRRSGVPTVSGAEFRHG